MHFLKALFKYFFPMFFLMFVTAVTEIRANDNGGSRDDGGRRDWRRRGDGERRDWGRRGDGGRRDWGRRDDGDRRDWRRKDDGRRRKDRGDRINYLFYLNPYYYDYPYLSDDDDCFYDRYGRLVCYDPVTGTFYYY